MTMYAAYALVHIKTMLNWRQEETGCSVRVDSGHMKIALMIVY